MWWLGGHIGLSLAGPPLEARTKSTKISIINQNPSHFEPIITSVTVWLNQLLEIVVWFPASLTSQLHTGHLGFWFPGLVAADRGSELFSSCYALAIVQCIFNLSVNKTCTNRKVHIAEVHTAQWIIKFNNHLGGHLFLNSPQSYLQNMLSRNILSHKAESFRALL